VVRVYLLVCLPAPMTEVPRLDILDLRMEPLALEARR
jgi:hypothetical protein